MVGEASSHYPYSEMAVFGYFFLPGFDQVLLGFPPFLIEFCGEEVRLYPKDCTEADLKTCFQIGCTGLHKGWTREYWLSAPYENGAVEYTQGSVTTSWKGEGIEDIELEWSATVAGASSPDWTVTGAATVLSNLGVTMKETYPGLLPGGTAVLQYSREADVHDASLVQGGVTIAIGDAAGVLRCP